MESTGGEQDSIKKESLVKKKLIARNEKCDM